MDMGEKLKHIPRTGLNGGTITWWLYYLHYIVIKKDTPELNCLSAPYL